jgi:hypothetical protein
LALDEQQIIRLLESGLKKGGYTHSVLDIVADLKAGRMQAFLNDGAIAITQIASFPQKRVLELLWCAGVLDDVIGLKEKLIEFAKENECTMGRAYVRPGLVGPLEQAGWRKAQTVMFFDMEN